MRFAKCAPPSRAEVDRIKRVLFPDFDDEIEEGRFLSNSSAMGSRKLSNYMSPSGALESLSSTPKCDSIKPCDSSPVEITSRSAVATPAHNGNLDSISDPIEKTAEKTPRRRPRTKADVRVIGNKRMGRKLFSNKTPDFPPSQLPSPKPTRSKKATPKVKQPKEKKRGLSAKAKAETYRLANHEKILKELNKNSEDIKRMLERKRRRAAETQKLGEDDD